MSCCLKHPENRAKLVILLKLPSFNASFKKCNRWPKETIKPQTATKFQLNQSLISAYYMQLWAQGENKFSFAMYK